MRNLYKCASLLALMAGTAHAGGVDRSGQSVAPLFETGDYVELSYGNVSPDVSGVATVFSPTPGGSSGDMAGGYSQFGFAYKHSFGNGFDAAIIVDQPFGANVSYPVAPYFATGSTAELRSTAITGLVKYTTPQHFSVYGGLRYQTFSAKAHIPFVAGYNGTGESDEGLGYVLGVAYEIPDIALRVALTYNSKIKHEMPTTESLFEGGLAMPDSTTTVNTPESVNLEFQTGVAADTLLFGSVRWVDWSNFAIDPAYYPPLEPIVSYEDDTLSLSLGLGRKFNEHWSGAVSLGYEDRNHGFSSNLGPTDGYRSIGVGASYTQDNVKVTMGLRYVEIGDAVTTLDGSNTASNFTDNHALGVGLRVGYSF